MCVGKCMARLIVIFVLVLGLVSFPTGGSTQTQTATNTFYITMHSAPIDGYCAPCIASEKLLQESGLEYRKVLEPEGPWPWFQLTDIRGNQRRVSGALSSEDIAKIKNGEWPDKAK